jgi:hypothetical protein
MRRTVEVARAGPRPTIRLRRVPQCEPPYDDEREQPFWPLADQLALDWSPAALARAGILPPPTTPELGDGEALPTATSGLDATQTSGAAKSRLGAIEASGPAESRLGTTSASGGTGGTGTLTAAPSTRARIGPVVTGTSTDAKAAVHRFVRLCVEVLNGYRPAAHLRRFSLPGDAAGVVAQGLAAAQRVASLRKAAQTPGRRAPRRPSPAAVVRLRLCEPRPGAVEAAVALVTGERTWALALRLELHQDIWSATALRLI